MASWGLVSGWSITGSVFCESSSASFCINAGLPHGQTTPPGLASYTYNLGTWAFDAVGDYPVHHQYN